MKRLLFGGLALFTFSAQIIDAAATPKAWNSWYKTDPAWVKSTKTAISKFNKLNDNVVSARAAFDKSPDSVKLSDKSTTAARALKMYYDILPNYQRYIISRNSKFDFYGKMLNSEGAEFVVGLDRKPVAGLENMTFDQALNLFNSRGVSYGASAQKTTVSMAPTPAQLSASTVVSPQRNRTGAASGFNSPLYPSSPLPSTPKITGLGGRNRTN